MKLRGLLHKGRSRRRLLALATVFLGAGSLFLVAPAAQAVVVPRHGFGYVWANDPSSEIGVPYRPDPQYSFNSHGLENTVVRLGPGRYKVTFFGFGPFGTTMVTAYGTTNADNYCKVDHWAAAPILTPLPVIANTELFVNCFSRTGAPLDSQFTATYTDPDPGMARGAYVWNSLASAALNSSYVPSPTFQYNPTGTQNTIKRIATGRYQVTLPGLAPIQGPSEFLVVAYGASPDPSAYCNLQAASQDGTSVFANVDCFRAAGDPVDSRFVLTYVESGDTLFTPTGSRTMAYADIACMDLLGRSVCPGFKGRPSDGLSVSTVSNGEWAVFLPVGLGAGNVQVTTRSDGRVPRPHCKVAFWGNGQGVHVLCRDDLGQPVTRVRFTVSFVA